MASDDPLKRLVCVNCKLRKKKCDKIQPRCGYCSRKKLNCQWKHGDSKRVSVEQELSLAAAPNPLIRSSLLLSHSLSEVLRSRPTNADSIIYLRVLRIVQTTGQFVDDISARYFRGIHTFIPVISRRRIHDQHLVAFGAPPPPSFSILLLSMCLITYHPEFASSAPNHLDQETLYLATKSLFAQVQASFPPSLDLIQAGIIIATYEYANGKIQDAFTSIGACARMGYAARLHLAKPVKEMDAEACQKAEEEANTWWGIIICERVFYCETDDDFQQPFVTKVPGAGFELQTESSSPSQNANATFKLLNSAIDFTTMSNIDGFVYIAQATCFLDQVFKTMNMTEVDFRYNRLHGLDHTLRAFYALILEDSDGQWGSYCTARSIVLRGLFLVHSYILNHMLRMSSPMDKSPYEWVESSYAALNTMTNMMEDISTAHNVVTLPLMDTLPPSSSFVIRAALRYIRESEIQDGSRDVAQKQLEKGLQQFDRRWGAFRHSHR